MASPASTSASAPSTPSICWFLGPHDGSVGAGQRTRQLVEALTQANLSIQFIREPAPQQELPLHEAVAKIKAQWQAERPLCAHVEVPGNTGEAWRVAAAEMGIPLMCTWHPVAWMAPDADKPAIQHWLRFFTGFCQQVLTETSEVRHALAADAILDTTLSVSGVDQIRYSPHKRSRARRQGWGARDDDVVILHVGRLQPEKNLGLLADTCNALKTQFPRVQCVVAGSGSAAPELQQACPHLQFLGHITGDDLAETYASADVFLFPSNADMYGNVALEAAASGLAIVAFDRAAAGAHLQHAAALIPLDDNQAYVHAALELLHDSERRQNLGRAARAAIEQVTWTNTAQQFLTAISRARRGFSKLPTTGISPVRARIRGALPDDLESEPLATIRYLNARGHHLAWDHDPAIPVSAATIHCGELSIALTTLFPATEVAKSASAWPRLLNEGRLCAWARQHPLPLEPLRIAGCLALPFSTSGSANRFSLLVQGLRDLGHAVHINVDPIGPSLAGKPVDPSKTQEHMKKLFALLYQRWTHDRPHVIYIEVLDIFGVSAARAAQHLKIPWVATWHPLGDWTSASHRATFEAGLHQLGATAAALVAESQTQLELAQAHHLPCTTIVSNGVDLQRFAPHHQSARLRESWNCRIAVLALGRLKASKNVAELIRVYHALTAIPDARLIIAGDGDERAHLEKAMPKALFLGLVPDKDIPEIYASADLFVFPSRVESYGMVVAEALASGLPVIGYDRAAMADLVTDGINGRRIPLNDDPESPELSQAVVDFCKLLPDPTHTTAARAAAEKYSWQRSSALLATELTRIIQTISTRTNTTC